MRARTAAAAAAAVLLPLTACEPTRTDTGAPTPSVSVPTTPPTGEAPKTAELPDLAGKGLQTAQDTAQEAGFYNLTSHDATGRGRMQISDRGWKVCFQTPAPGEHPVTGKIDFGTVKLEEDCPASDAGAESAKPADDGKMPNLVGKSVRAAFDTLPSNASIQTTDASGQDRIVLNGANWKVCTQTPAAGAAFDGEPVTLRTVKYEETCP
ncbi:hypothetical protein [Streptomyces sp. DH37]|uniref:hypothetical protein n=1 Tax=Streptomyces sp. DH37 TaxID=3040122 RepID=UPI002441D029|nr:hypothetical protein [Streptomyces sp. DH37]MDG9702878.1 hypothetical protein [Streptomyces sp. DH37]